MAAIDAVIPLLYFLRVDQFMKDSFFCPVTDIVYPTYLLYNNFGCRFWLNFLEFYIIMLCI